MDEEDRIQKEDRDYCDKQDRQRDILETDKKVISDWIEFHLYASGDWTPLKDYRLRMSFNRMQIELEELMYEFQEEMDKL
jgi:hypothetical protein